MIEYTVTLRSEVAGFTPRTFTEWIGHDVVITGLDPNLRHVLRSVQNAEDGTWCTLTVNSYEHEGPSLTPSLSVIPGQPKAQVRIYEDGAFVLTAWLDAPLYGGSQVEINNELYNIVSTSYPYRDVNHPEDHEDWERVDVRLEPKTDTVRDLGVQNDG